MRVFVNNNMRTEADLADGALGEVVHVHWADGDRLPSLPQCVCSLYVPTMNSDPQYVSQDCITHNGVRIDLVDVIPIAPFEV